MLLVVIAMFFAAAWLSAPPKAGRGLQSYWLQEKLDAHRRFVDAQVMDDLRRARSGYAPANADVIRRFYQKCGSY
jgi:hypothetical protein